MKKPLPGSAGVPPARLSNYATTTDAGKMPALPECIFSALPPYYHQPQPRFIAARGSMQESVPQHPKQWLRDRGSNVEPAFGVQSATDPSSPACPALTSARHVAIFYLWLFCGNGARTGLATAAKAVLFNWTMLMQCRRCMSVPFTTPFLHRLLWDASAKTQAARPF